MKRFKWIAAAAASLGGYVNRLNDYPVPFVDIPVIVWCLHDGHLVIGRWEYEEVGCMVDGKIGDGF